MLNGRHARQPADSKSLLPTRSSTRATKPLDQSPESLSTPSSAARAEETRRLERRRIPGDPDGFRSLAVWLCWLAMEDAKGNGGGSTCEGVTRDDHESAIEFLRCRDERSAHWWAQAGVDPPSVRQINACRVEYFKKRRWLFVSQHTDGPGPCKSV
jgi:hypothetical protein